MNHLESRREDLHRLREDLHRLIEKGSHEDIIKASQKLDKLILEYMQDSLRYSTKSA